MVVMMDPHSQLRPIGMVAMVMEPPQRLRMKMVEINNPQQQLLMMMAVMGKAQQPRMIGMDNIPPQLPIGGTQPAPQIGGILQQQPTLFLLPRLTQHKQLTILILMQQPRPILLSLPPPLRVLKRLQQSIQQLPQPIMVEEKTREE